jgi:predicted unusual protein kinase regulating ubiquinone biosynthesis (AarF/ABC1/UbiB family)
VKGPSGKARYRRIVRFAARHLFVAWWYEIVLPVIGLRRVADRSRARRLQHFARKYRVLAVELGGLMIKVGQYMSTRLDVLPPEFTRELEGLQDEVPAVPFDEIRALAEAELGVPLSSVYASFSPEPVAAASLGQAHRAVLGELDAASAGFSDVVVKVQRPGIAEIVSVDLAALRRVAGWLMHFRVVYRRANAPALIEEFAEISLAEIDYLSEAANVERFAEMFAGDARVRAPEVVWERTTRQVLTLEDVTAIKITDGERLRAAGISPGDVANVFAEVMFEQLFSHGFFHADPHPGNLFVTPAPAGAEVPWTLTFVDFGMMGEVPPVLRTTLRQLIIAAAARDGRGMVKAMVESGVLLPNADTSELEHVMTQVFARFGGMGFAELRELDPREFTAFAREFGDVLLEMPFQLPENFLLIGRATSLTSGLCSSLEPSYNLWDSIEPYAAQLVRDEGGNLVRDVGKQAMENLQIAWRLPARVDDLLTQAEEGRLAVATPRLERSVARAERTVRRLVWAVVFAGLIVGGALVRPEDPGLGNALMLAAVVPGLVALFGGRRG